MKRSVLNQSANVLGLAAAFLLGGLVLPARRFAAQNPAPLVVIETARAAPPMAGGDAVADAADKAGPAVVKIDTVTVERSPWEDFFGNDPFFGQSRQRTGTGSGFLISGDGYILTNEHVISGADKITVCLADGRQVRGQVVGADFQSDLAVVRIPQKNLPAPPQFSTASLRPGQWAIAIGNPYGLEHTVTLGVISATKRPMQIDNRTYDNLIQTDCAINPVNSGGPLLNINGEVIGINTAILANAQGLGFAIPIGFARGVADELIRYGKVKRPYTGLYVRTLTREWAEYLGMRAARGAIAIHVAPGSPAHNAGIRRGDVILEIDGHQVENGDNLALDLKKRRIGDHVKLQILRGGATGTTEMHVGEAP